MHAVTNPILPGFNPDPCLLRVGGDYYIAVSTFQWFPGVTVYHSTDLAHWRLLTNILDRPSQLDLSGVGDSVGIYAPQISFKDGLFYLVYTVVRRNAWPFIDSPNYVVWAPAMTGPWSDPVFLHARGIDPSLFHDTDGRSYLVTNEVDFRQRTDNARIVMQEYSTDRRCLVGDCRRICDAFAEGPHLYHRGAWYYLLVAVGGTDYNHAEEVYRSRSVWGPYAPSPHNPLITSRDAPDIPLQKAGHASLVDTPTGAWYLAHLVGRPVMPQKKCPLGRESALQKIKWTDDGWPRLAGGGHVPQSSIEVPPPLSPPHENDAGCDDFEAPVLSPHFLTLRDRPDASWLSLLDRPGWLRLRGRASPMSYEGQSLVARRLRSLHARVETCVEFDPTSYRHMAGLMVYYDTRNFFFLHLTHDESVGRCIRLLRQNGNGGWHAREALPAPIPYPSTRCHLGADIAGPDVRFRYSMDGVHWQGLDPVLDLTELSDEQNEKYGFTGTMVGMAAYDMVDGRKWAEFDCFGYRDLPEC